MTRKLLLAILATLTVATNVNASTITYSIIPGPGGPGTFALTASTSLGDNFGLDYYAVALQGAATIQHVNVSPKLIDFDTGQTYGFSFARSADNVSVVSAAQDSTGGGVAVYGLGQTAGTLKSLVPAGDAAGSGKPNSVGTYGAPLVLATGTYLNNIPPMFVDGAATGFVFTSKGTGGAFGQFAAPTSIVLKGGLNCLDGCPIITSDVIDDVYANVPGLLTYTFKVQSEEGPGLSNLTLDSYVPAPDVSGTGPAVPPTLDLAYGKFIWNTVGSPLGTYKWHVFSTNIYGTSVGFLTVHITAVPEPASFALVGLGLVCCFGFHSRS